MRFLRAPAIGAATKNNRLFTVDVDGEVYYQVFFAVCALDRNVLERVACALGELPGWTKWDFFVSRRGCFGNLSALEVLGEGKVDFVEKVARAFHEEMAR